MLSGIKMVRPRKTGISNPLSTNRLEHFLTADCKSAETPSGAEETYPTGQKECLLMQECLPSGVLPDMLSGIKKVRPRKTGISNPLSTNRLGHFLTADYKSAETPGGAEETYPTGQISHMIDPFEIYVRYYLIFSTDLLHPVACLPRLSMKGSRVAKCLREMACTSTPTL